VAAWSASVRRIQLEEGRVKTCEMSGAFTGCGCPNPSKLWLVTEGKEEVAGPE